MHRRTPGLLHDLVSRQDERTGRRRQFLGGRPHEATMKRIPVHIEGDWQPVAHRGELRWAGLATADEPFTGLALGRTSAGIDWARAGRSETRSFDLRLSIHPFETHQDGRAALISFSMQPAGVPQGRGLAILQLRSLLTSTAPFMFGLDHIETGVASWFVRIHTFDKDSIGALFVAASDTRSARNHLWHLREGVEGSDASLTDALRRGRTGRIISA